MTWETKVVTINGADVTCQVDGKVIELPYNEDVEKSTPSIKIDGVDYLCLNILNVANRNETLLIETRESDESASRGNKNKSSRKSVSGETES